MITRQCEWINVYQRYKDKLVELLEKGLSREDLDLISREFLEIMEKVCRECQANRMHCILMPKCGRNRSFLSMLIEMGVKKGDLPEFCYFQFLKEIQMTFKGTKTLRDASVPLEDFLKTVFKSHKKIFDLIMSRNIKDLIKILGKEAIVKNRKISALNKNNRIYFVIDGLNFYVDISRKLVHFNPYNTPITSINELEAFIELFSSEADMNVELEREIGGILNLDVHFPVKIEGDFESSSNLINNVFEKYRDKIEPFFNHIHLHVSPNRVHIILDLEMYDFEKLRPLTPKDIADFFKVLKEFRNDISKHLTKT